MYRLMSPCHEGERDQNTEIEINLSGFFFRLQKQSLIHRGLEAPAGQIIIMMATCPTRSTLPCPAGQMRRRRSAVTRNSNELL